MDYTKELITLQALPPGREEAGAPAVDFSLGNTTKLWSTFDDQLNRRVTRYLLQSVISEILPNERVAKCLHLVVPSAAGVKVMYSEKVQRAHYKGLTVCGSVWSCPVCSAKISERRRLEIRPALEVWPGGLIMASYTLQHSLADNLTDLKNLLYDCYHKLMSGREWQDIKNRWGIAGLISSSEITWGPVSGWHPHKHALIFTKNKLTNEELKRAETEISARFRALLAKNGRYGHPDFSVKFRTGNIFEETEYVFKWGVDYELTKSNVKKARSGNYSPFELAQWAGIGGDLQPVRLFQEYFSVYKGSHQLQYTKGLRSLLGLEQQKSDYDLAVENDQQAVELALLARSAWAMVCKQKKRGDLLEVASTGSVELLAEFLKNIGAIQHD